MKITCNKKEGVYIKNGMMYIAGTRGFNDVMDWAKIPLGTFDKSEIYKNAEKIHNENKEKVKIVIGHSAGGSAALQLHQKYPNDIIPITYNAPVFSIANGLSDVDKSLKPFVFVTRFDPVSALDYQARVTERKFDINIDFIENAAKVYTDPSIQNITNVVKSGFQDPLFGQHKMQGTYSNPSSIKDITESAVKAVSVGNIIGGAIL